MNKRFYIVLSLIIVTQIVVVFVLRQGVAENTDRQFDDTVQKARLAKEKMLVDSTQSSNQSSKETSDKSTNSNSSENSEEVENNNLTDENDENTETEKTSNYLTFNLDKALEDDHTPLQQLLERTVEKHDDYFLLYRHMSSLERHIPKNLESVKVNDVKFSEPVEIDVERYEALTTDASIMSNPVWNKCEKHEVPSPYPETLHCSAVHDGKRLFMLFEWQDSKARVISFDDSDINYIVYIDNKFLQEMKVINFMKPGSFEDFLSAKVDEYENEIWYWMSDEANLQGVDSEWQKIRRVNQETRNRWLKRREYRSDRYKAPMFAGVPASEFQKLKKENGFYSMSPYKQQGYSGYSSIKMRLYFWLHNSYLQWLRKDFAYELNSFNPGRGQKKPELKHFLDFDGQKTIRNIQSPFIDTGVRKNIFGQGNWKLVLIREFDKSGQSFELFGPGKSVQGMFPFRETEGLIQSGFILNIK